MGPYELERKYPDWYKTDSDLSYDEQRWIWENIQLPFDEDQRLRGTQQIENTNVIGSVNGGHKLQGNLEETLTKLQANVELKQSNYRTPPKKIAYYLEILFGQWEEKPEHWLYIARRYTPKTINAVIYQINKRIDRGEVSPINNGAYFTSVIKHKQIKKVLRKARQ